MQTITPTFTPGVGITVPAIVIPATEGNSPVTHNIVTGDNGVAAASGSVVVPAASSAAGAPAAPTGLSASTAWSNNGPVNTVSWLPVPGTTYYEVYDSGSIVESQVKGTTLNDSGMAPGANCSYTVAAVGPGGASPLSIPFTIVSATAPVIQPAVPSDFFMLPTDKVGMTVGINLDPTIGSYCPLEPAAANFTDHAPIYFLDNMPTLYGWTNPPQNISPPATAALSGMWLTHAANMIIHAKDALKCPGDDYGHITVSDENNVGDFVTYATFVMEMMKQLNAPAAGVNSFVIGAGKVLHSSTTIMRNWPFTQGQGPRNWWDVIFRLAGSLLVDPKRIDGAGLFSNGEGLIFSTQGDQLVIQARQPLGKLVPVGSQPALKTWETFGYNLSYSGSVGPGMNPNFETPGLRGGDLGNDQYEPLHDLVDKQVLDALTNPPQCVRADYWIGQNPITGHFHFVATENGQLVKSDDIPALDHWLGQAITVANAVYQYHSGIRPPAKKTNVLVDDAALRIEPAFPTTFPIAFGRPEVPTVTA